MSKYLPVRLVARYEESLSDPELLNLREDIAVLDTRLVDILGRVDTHEAGYLWKKAKDLLAELIKALRTGEAETVATLVNELNRTVGQGTSDYAVWNEVKNLLDQRRRMVESERKRLVEMQQMITAEQAWKLMSAVWGAVNESVKDAKVRAKLQAEFIRLASIGDDASLGNGR